MLAAIKKEYRSLPVTYWTLWLGTLVNKAGGFVIPFLALYITAQGGSEADAGLVMALYGAGAILAGVTGGVLADRVGRRATILFSVFGGAVSMLAIGFSRSLPAIGATTFLMGWAAEMYRPAVSAATADLVPAADRTRAYGHLYWANNLGFAIAPTLGGILALASYTSLFIGDAVTMVAFGALVLARVPETRPEAAPPEGEEKRNEAAGRAGAGLGAALADLPFLGFVLLMLGLMLVMWQDRTSLPLDMRRHGIGEATYGWIVSINGVLVVLFQPRITRALLAYPRAGVLACASFLFGLGYGLYGVVGSVPGYVLAVVVTTVGEMAAVPTASAVVADLAPAAQRGRYQGVYSMSFGVASCLGPLLGVAVLHHAGGRALWLGCFAVMLLVTVGQLALGPALTARETAARAPARA
ncbi:MDR family MFS transporter [Trinickia fusca]|uniref:MFS transporter n=1 Tax=Trinickia fusca TaxID=2419777 RepID=A0A494XHT7_9BURK|nr:MFS transporter [Trinickia fusca]RKP49301.1 MFS transporter [Trinickia fusca]